MRKTILYPSGDRVAPTGRPTSSGLSNWIVLFGFTSLKEETMWFVSGSGASTSEGLQCKLWRLWRFVLKPKLWKGFDSIVYRFDWWNFAGWCRLGRRRVFRRKMNMCKFGIYRVLHISPSSICTSVWCVFVCMWQEEDEDRRVRERERERDLGWETRTGKITLVPVHWAEAQQQNIKMFTLTMCNHVNVCRDD